MTNSETASLVRQLEDSAGSTVLNNLLLRKLKLDSVNLLTLISPYLTTKNSHTSLPNVAQTTTLHPQTETSSPLTDTTSQRTRCPSSGDRTRSIHHRWLDDDKDHAVCELLRIATRATQRRRGAGVPSSRLVCTIVLDRSHG